MTNINKYKDAKGAKHYKAGPARKAIASKNMRIVKAKKLVDTFHKLLKHAPDFKKIKSMKYKFWYWGSLAALWGGIAVLLTIVYFAFDLPSIDNIASIQRKPSITIIDANGEKITSIDDLYGNAVKLEELPDYVWQTIVSTEDKRFFNHGGVDFYSLARAMFANLKAGRVVQGGSSLTQQLAKNIFLSREQTIKRKIQEMILAFWLEMKFTKKQILSLYLNRVSLVGGKYGINIASETLFGKPANQMSLYQASIIAAMLKAPSKYDPRRNPIKAKERSKIVLQHMIDQKYITEDQAKLAFQDPVTYTQEKLSSKRYFVDYIIEQLHMLLGNIQTDIIVNTTLDLNLQENSEKVLEKYLNKYSKYRRIDQGAILIMDNDGAVKTMIGGRDYVQSQFNRATQAKRQPGSLYKPFVFVSALENGYEITDIIEDRPIRINNWTPQNYDKKYRGYVTVKDALAKSINTIPVIIAKHLGLNKIIKTTKRLGVANNIRGDYSIVLGSNESRLIDMVSAFNVFARDGISNKPYTIENIISRSGHTLYQKPFYQGTRLIEQSVNKDMLNMLNAVVLYGTGTNANLSNIGIKNYGKTGTSQENRDAWFIGFTDEYCGGVWLGNDDNRSMKSVYGGAIPARIWKDIMISIYK